jgi:hypothetical protein
MGSSTNILEWMRPIAALFTAAVFITLSWFGCTATAHAQQPVWVDADDQQIAIVKNIFARFGPEVRYQNGCSAEQGENLAPCFGLQFFGRVDIERDGVMMVTLKDVGDRNLWSVRIDPSGDERSAIRFAQKRD